MKKIILPLIAFLTLMSTTLCTPRKATEKERQIRHAVEQQMCHYPQSTLRDLYKNFFQDYFGPGHLIADTTSAARYLRSELASTTSFKGMRYEPTGYLGNFYRVNLSVLHDTLVEFSLYFDAFVRSVNNIRPISHEAWISEWDTIEKVIIDLGLDTLPYFQSDRQAIRKLFEQGGYAMHHSEAYSKAYDPHYRIIEKEIFKNEILPLIDRQLTQGKE